MWLFPVVKSHFSNPSLIYEVYRISRLIWNILTIQCWISNKFFDIVKLDRLYVWTSQNITPLHLSPPSNINSGQWVHRQMPVSYVSGIGECGIFHQILTSSTAQGGGGSFKNRKPIGEVGCCESGMAERSHWWTERCLRSPLFLSLSLFFSLCICHLSSCLPVYLSLSLSFIGLSV